MLLGLALLRLVLVACDWHFGQLGDERNSDIAFGSPQVAQMRQCICVMDSVGRYRDLGFQKVRGRWAMFSF